MRFLFFIFLFLPTFAVSQGAATLVADNVTVNSDKQLIATGNVEVFYLDTSLRASQIIYDQAGDQLIINGPIFIKAADGTILTADRASLDPRLENGMLQGARLVLNQQLQVAANQIDRQDGRYSQLYKTTASSCNVCGNEAPLWSIRSERVVHDDVEKQLYFENATFLIRDFPIFWVPRMRLPDPSLERSTGLLIPELPIDSQLGTGIKLPYFIALGDHRDLTVTPYVSQETTTIELIYRQAFANGSIRAEGAVSKDTLLPENRSYIFANGNFKFDNDYQLNVDIEATSDPAYLLEYGYSDKDRLDSALDLLRVTNSSLTQLNFTYYETLRDDESNKSLPPLVGALSYEKRLQPAFGGTLSFGAGLDTAYRYSNTNGDAGRDVTRGGAWGRWHDQWIWGPGIVATVETGLRFDIYTVRDDANYDQNDLRVVPDLGVTLRWPWAMTTATGTSHLIEPTVQFASSDQFGGIPPNEDSTRNEFDQGNLFSLSRFSGEDAVETGNRLALGATWTRAGTAGMISTLTFGRVYRQNDDTQYTPSSGLDGRQSDWLVAAQVQIPDGFVFDAQALFDNETEITRASGLVAWKNDKVSLAAAYIWQAKDAEENRLDTLSEWTVDGSFEINDMWSVSADGRYDVAADSPVRAGLGVKWRNECVTIDVSASRRYTSSTTVEPTTNYGLSGSISGFSAGRSVGGPSGRCRN